VREPTPVTPVFLLLTIVVTSCAPTETLRYPPFQGDETESWLAYGVQLPEREPSDLLPSFEARARSHGCIVERLGGRSEQMIGGEMRHWHGVAASCDDGNIALVTWVGGWVRIGCTKPTTRERCDLLLRKISDAR
jgi:hypothetical protein